MKDPYRFENMTEDELANARQLMLDAGILENRVDRILASPDAAEAFNKRPQEVRQKFFQRTGAMAGMDLGDIIRKRLESAPDEKPTDMRSIITERMADIDKAEKDAITKEQQTLAAAVPQVDASGRVVSAPAAPAPKRSLTDYVKGVGETVAALGS